MNKITKTFQNRVIDIMKSNIEMNKKKDFLQKAKSILASNIEPEDKLIDLDKLIKEIS